MLIQSGLTHINSSQYLESRPSLLMLNRLALPDVVEPISQTWVHMVYLNIFGVILTLGSLSCLNKLPVNELPKPDSKVALSNVVLADGWMAPAQLYCHIHNKPKPYTKAYTFMASEGMFDQLLTKLASTQADLLLTTCYHTKKWLYNRTHQSWSYD